MVPFFDSTHGEWRSRLDTTVIDCQQHKIGQMADFHSLLASSIFDFENMMYLKLNLHP